MNKKIIGGIVVILIAVVAIVAFQNNTDTNTNEKIRVGAVLPLTGPYAVVGESVKNAMVMSLDDLDNKNIELYFEDGEADSAKAVSAYNKLQTINNVDIVIGLDNQTLEPIKPIINQSDELMFTVGNESTIENDNVFEIIPWATALFNVLAKEISGKHEKIAIVYATDWQLASANKAQFLKGLQNQNYIEIPVSSNSDTRTEVAKMLAEGVDAYTLFLTVDQGAKFLNEVAKQSGDKRPQVICDGNIELTIGEYLGKVIDKNIFEGCISTMIADTTNKEYVAKYKAKFGAEPNFLGVYGYDAVQVISKVLAGEKKSNWKKVLENDKLVFDGMSGKIVFDDTGSRVLESQVNVFKNGAFVKLEK